MNPRLLDYYNRELRYITALAMEFAQDHPKIARRLGMQAGEVGDPYVERLLQSFSFVTAHTEMRIDDEFPEFMQPLLETVYPNYASPVPSMAVARLLPSHDSALTGKGFTLPRGSAFMTSKPPPGEKTTCQFRSSQNVTLYPLEITRARLTGIPPDIPSLARYVPPHLQVRSALRLRLRITTDIAVSSLEGLDRLPVYLAGDERTASHLFELIHSSAIATVIGEPDQFATRPFHVVTHDAVVHEGLAPEQSLLPAVTPELYGHNLLHEYFACPARFWFFTLTGLVQGLSALAGNEVEIVILLSRPLEAYADRVDASHFALFCTPLINLFPLHTRRFKLQANQTEHPIIHMPSALTDYEVHSVQAAHGQVSEDSAEELFWPSYRSLNYDEDDHGRYFTIRRNIIMAARNLRQYGTRRPFTETHTTISLVDGNGMHYDGGIRYLSVDAWLTNRDLPSLIVPNGTHDLTVDGSVPIAGIGFVRAPTAPEPPLARGERAWQLYGQLGLDYTLFDDNRDNNSSPGERMRRRLRLLLTEDDMAHRQQVESLVSAVAKPVNRLIPEQGSVALGRGIECELTFNEAGFDGISPYTFGLALEHYVARHVSKHSFTTTVLHTKQRGRIANWPPRFGTRSVI